MSAYTPSKRARQDIIQITRNSLVDFGEVQTAKYMTGLKDQLQLLAEQPDLGRTFVHERSQREYRFFRYMSHAIYYRKRKNDIFITRILHGKMLPEKHL